MRLRSEVAWLHNRDVSPISRLPAETLSFIFELVRGDTPWSDATPSFSRTNLRRGIGKVRRSWIQITEVCKHWRSIALGCPRLWSRIVVRSGTWSDHALLRLDRSKGVPLDIHIPTFQCPELDMIKNLTSRCTQLRRLDIDDIEDVRRLAAFKSPAPLLERLCIISKDRINRVLPVMFSKSTPHLKYLFLYRVRAPPQTSFTHLSHLYLSAQTLHFRDFMALVHANARMERLVLQSCTSNDAEDVPFTTKSSLPTLKEIAFADCNAFLLRALLLRLDIPTEGVAMVCTRWSPQAMSGASVFPPAARSGLRPLLTVHTLAIDLSTAELLATNASSVIRLAPSHGRRDIPSLLRFDSVMNMHSLQELRLSQCRDCPAGLLRPWLSQMVALRKLSLDQPHTEWFVALTPEGLGSTDLRPVPALKTLEIVPTTPQGIEPNCYLDALVAMVVSRCIHACRIEELRIVGHDAAESDKSSDSKIQKEMIRLIETRQATLNWYVDRIEFTSHNAWSAPELPSGCSQWIARTFSLADILRP